MICTAPLLPYGAPRRCCLTPVKVRAAACHFFEKLKIPLTIWQLGKNNLSALGACCFLHVAGADDQKSLRSFF
jgi:hypothetical protein